VVEHLVQKLSSLVFTGSAVRGYIRAIAGATPVGMQGNGATALFFEVREIVND
jgi:hypothetical protein